jgi:hypothetical protein
MSKYKILYFLIFLSVSITILGQEKDKSTKDTLKATVNVPNQKKQDTIKKPLDDTIKALNDTSKVVVGAPNNQITKDTVNTQDSPLDIDENRGIFIMADNGNTQFRILGSIRFSALFDNKLLSDKSRFNTYDIPTGEADFSVINYYNSLMFSRIGFEVTRKTSIGNIFIRLETDFAGQADGQSSAYRIRHAYAQFNQWLIGQTWSLFSNVHAQATSVNRTGSPGTISIRTPQIRYSFNIPFKKLKGSVAYEYSLPELSETDSISANYLNVQTVPNLTVRISSNEKFGYAQLSGIAAPITGIDTLGNKSTFLGFGISFSGYWKTHNENKLIFQTTYTRAVSHFINMFRDNNLDLVYNPIKQDFEALSSWSVNLAYEHTWKSNLSSTASFGMADIVNTEFQPPTSYNYSYSASLNTFWTIVQGARIGLEYMYGERFNTDNSKGNASRIWALFYYDF